MNFDYINLDFEIFLNFLGNYWLSLILGFFFLWLFLNFFLQVPSLESLDIMFKRLRHYDSELEAKIEKLESQIQTEITSEYSSDSLACRIEEIEEKIKKLEAKIKKIKTEEDDEIYLLTVDENQWLVKELRDLKSRIRDVESNLK